MSEISVFLVDDHELIRLGIRKALEKDKDIHVVGEAESAEEALAQLPALNPAIAFIDISLPGMNGMMLIRELKSMLPDLKIIVLSMYHDEEYISTCIEIGVDGYLVKSSGPREVHDAVSAVLNNKNYYSSKVQDVIMESYIKSKGSKVVVENQAATLTQRENEIIDFVVEGYTSQEISDKLFISPRTVDTHRSNIMKKLGVKNSAELVRRILEMRKP